MSLRRYLAVTGISAAASLFGGDAARADIDEGLPSPPVPSLSRTCPTVTSEPIYSPTKHEISTGELDVSLREIEHKINRYQTYLFGLTVGLFFGGVGLGYCIGALHTEGRIRKRIEQSLSEVKEKE